ncbi:MAG: cytochrome c [Ferruginibacter sp.]
MKKIKIISLLSVVIGASAMLGCGAGKNEPGRVYMPDMAYSQAYETYAAHDSAIITRDPSKKGGKAIFYNATPAAGTIKRGELFPYSLPHDSIGYRLSAKVENPIKNMSVILLPEAERLYNINCGICHGEKADGNGPLASSGKIGGIANLTSPLYSAMSDGTMFHSITYGKGVMGSYASQLTREQRWMVINFIRTLQPDQTTKTTVDNSTSTDSTVKKG